MIIPTAALVVSPAAVSVLRLAGPVCTIALQSAALDTARKIFTSKTTGSLSPLPFISLFTNCLIWTYYGVLVKDMSLLVPNFMGVLAGLASVVIFQVFGSKAPLKEYSVAAVVIALATYFLAQKSAWEVGILGCALSVVLMASPLATLGVILKSKSTESLPLGTSIVTAANAVSWTLYGLLVAEDPMIYVPSALGLIPSSLQMFLYAKFGLPNAPHVAQNSDAVSKSLF